jgi:amino acid permease
LYTFANILKLYLGIAFLGLPQGISLVGVRPAIFGLVWILLINCFTTYLLIKARNKYKQEVISSLSDLAVKCLGPEAKTPTDAVILVTQASFLIAYQVYAGE